MSGAPAAARTLGRCKGLVHGGRCGTRAAVAAALAMALALGVACDGPHESAPPPTGRRGPAPATTRQESPTVTVYKSPTCGCCTKWVDHLRANGFRVVVHDTIDVAPVRAARGVTGLLAACHTAIAGGYVVEGHVPAGDVWRLLREHPPIAGIAVPGMPAGAPGMEGLDPPDRFQVYAFDRDGGGGVFVRH